MVRLFKIGAIFTALATAVLAAYPNPGPIKGDTVTHDPSIVRRPDGLYIQVRTSPKLAITTSKDRITWTDAGYVFPNGAPSQTYDYTGAGADANLWAPDISYHGGKYILFFAASSFGSEKSAIFMVTSPTGLSGSWTYNGLVTASTSASGYNAIDPALIVDAKDGKWWLSFGSFWNGIQLVELNPTSGKPIGSVKTISSRPSNVNRAEEGSYIFQYGGHYYLFTSWDKCCDGTSSTYSIHVSRANSITGPYVDGSGVAALNGGGTKILGTHGSIYGPGGQSVFQDSDAPVLVYHYYTSSGSYLGLNLLKFVNGWPQVY